VSRSRSPFLTHERTTLGRRIRKSASREPRMGIVPVSETLGVVRPWKWYGDVRGYR